MKKAQIKAQTRFEAQVGALIFDKVSIVVLAEYFNYNDFFSAENVAKHPEHTRMNDHAINLEESKQPFFGLIYSLELVELETLKIYIETNLTNSFIRIFKFPADAFIIFDQKLNSSFPLCVDY